jgi:hypothetical protein
MILSNDSPTATLGASELSSEWSYPMPLTNIAIRNAKPGAKPTKLFNERGLYLALSH